MRKIFLFATLAWVLIMTPLCLFGQSCNTECTVAYPTSPEHCATSGFVGCKYTDNLGVCHVSGQGTSMDSPCSSFECGSQGCFDDGWTPDSTLQADYASCALHKEGHYCNYPYCQYVHEDVFCFAI